jgi:Ribosomal_S17 N-terminal
VHATGRDSPPWWISTRAASRSLAWIEASALFGVSTPARRKQLPTANSHLPSLVARIALALQRQEFLPIRTLSGTLIVNRTAAKDHDFRFPPFFDNRCSQSQAAIMATELTVQSERAYQKQPHIFLNQKQKAAKSKKSGSGRRWYKDVGLGFRTPKTAISGSYIG